MYKHSIIGITISSVLDSRRELANGKFPVKIRVTYKRERQYFTTGLSLSKNEWERLPSAKNAELLRARSAVQTTFNIITNAIELVIKNKSFTFDNLNLILGKGISSTINVAYRARIDKLILDEKYSTADTYKYSLKAIEDFGAYSLKFSDVTIEWLKRFEKHLLEKKKSFTTVSMYIRGIKTIMNEALSEGTINREQFPFGIKKYRIPQSNTRNLALSLKDIEKIFKYDCHNEKARYYRDLWIFSYLCNGANVADVANLKFGDIKGNKIEFYRQKTLNKSNNKKKITAFIDPLAQKIIDEWGNKNVKSNDYVFPLLNEECGLLEKRDRIKVETQFINYYIKRIGVKLNLGNLSTYTARHSFATVLKRSGAQISFISESLGHSNMIVTENYLSNFEDDAAIKFLSKLTDFETDDIR